jgi:hypothetical protein
LISVWILLLEKSFPIYLTDTCGSEIGEERTCDCLKIALIEWDKSRHDEVFMWAKEMSFFVDGKEKMDKYWIKS